MAIDGSSSSQGEGNSPSPTATVAVILAYPIPWIYQWYQPRLVFGFSVARTQRSLHPKEPSQGKEKLLTGEGLGPPAKCAAARPREFLSIPTRIGMPRCGEEEHHPLGGAKGAARHAVRRRRAPRKGNAPPAKGVETAAATVRCIAPPHRLKKGQRSALLTVRWLEERKEGEGEGALARRRGLQPEAGRRPAGALDRSRAERTRRTARERGEKGEARAARWSATPSPAAGAKPFSFSPPSHETWTEKRKGGRGRRARAAWWFAAVAGGRRRPCPAAMDRAAAGAETRERRGGGRV